MRSPFVALPVIVTIACSGSEFSSRGGSLDGTGGASHAGGGVGQSGASSGGASGGRAAGGSAGTVSHGGRAGGGTSGTGGASGGSGGNAGAPSSGGAPTDAGPGAGGGVTAIEAGPPGLTACPVTPPDPAAVCHGSFECSYGDDPRVRCRAVYSCQNGRFLASVSICTTQKSCFTDYNPLPVIGKACDPAGDFCTWDSGLACSCVPCNTGGGCAAVNVWSCAPAAAPPCPLSPPDEGQPCDSSAPSDCTYGACGVASQVVAHCKSSVWTWDFPTCG